MGRGIRVINQITTAEAQALGFVSLEHLECSHQPHAQDRGAKKRTQLARRLGSGCGLESPSPGAAVRILVARLRSTFARWDGGEGKHTFKTTRPPRKSQPESHPASLTVFGAAMWLEKRGPPPLQRWRRRRFSMEGSCLRYAQGDREKIMAVTG